MGTKFFYFILCLSFHYSWSQAPSKVPLHGQVVNDSLRIDNGYVMNINSKIRTVIKPGGFFDIPAKEKDTLVFLGLAFETKKIVLSRIDFTVPLLQVKLKAVVNKLDEVVINSKDALKPNLYNSQTYVDQKYYDDQWSSPKNAIYTPSGTIENPADFVRMYKDLKKILSKRKSDSDKKESKYTFSEIVLNNFNYTFFTNSLQLKEDEIALFLIYCENDPKSKAYLKNPVEFELMDFLIIKNEEFKKMTIFEK